MFLIEYFPALLVVNKVSMNKYSFILLYLKILLLVLYFWDIYCLSTPPQCYGVFSNVFLTVSRFIGHNLLIFSSVVLNIVLELVSLAMN